MAIGLMQETLNVAKGLLQCSRIALQCGNHDLARELRQQATKNREVVEEWFQMSLLVKEAAIKESEKK